MFPFRRSLAASVNMLLCTGTLMAGNKPSAPLFLPLSLDKALSLASRQNRIVFIDFCTTWCGACRKLDEDTWSDGKVIEQLKKKTVPLKIDADKEQIIRDKFKIRAYPTLLFLNSDGSILARIVGYQIPSQFIETLQGAIAVKGTRTVDPKIIDGDH